MQNHIQPGKSAKISNISNIAKKTGKALLYYAKKPLTYVVIGGAAIAYGLYGCSNPADPINTKVTDIKKTELAPVWGGRTAVLIDSKPHFIDSSGYSLGNGKTLSIRGISSANGEDAVDFCVIENDTASSITKAKKGDIVLIEGKLFEIKGFENPAPNNKKATTIIELNPIAPLEYGDLMGTKYASLTDGSNSTSSIIYGRDSTGKRVKYILSSTFVASNFVSRDGKDLVLAGGNFKYIGDTLHLGSGLYGKIINGEFSGETANATVTLKYVNTGVGVEELIVMDLADMLNKEISIPVRGSYNKEKIIFKATGAHFLNDEKTGLYLTATVHDGISGKDIEITLLIKKISSVVGDKTESLGVALDSKGASGQVQIENYVAK